MWQPISKPPEERLFVFRLLGRKRGDSRESNTPLLLPKTVGASEEEEEEEERRGGTDFFACYSFLPLRQRRRFIFPRPRTTQVICLRWREGWREGGREERPSGLGNSRQCGMQGHEAGWRGQWRAARWSGVRKIHYSCATATATTNDGPTSLPFILFSAVLSPKATPLVSQLHHPYHPSSSLHPSHCRFS